MLLLFQVKSRMHVIPLFNIKVLLISTLDIFKTKLLTKSV
jgi:hypothetical protein